MKHLKMALEDNLAAETTPKADETPTVVMTGPLSSIYTKALNLAFAKTEDGEGIVAAESQEMDEELLDARAQRKNDEEHSDDVVEIPYFYNPNTSKEEDRQEVSKALNQIGKKNVEFVFYQDETIPEVMAGQANGDLKGNRMLAVESIQVIVRLKKTKK